MFMLFNVCMVIGDSRGQHLDDRVGNVACL